MHRRAWLHHADFLVAADARRCTLICAVGWNRPACASFIDHAGQSCAASIHRHSRHAPRLFIGSHLDTVPHAGAFDGILGVVLGVALVESARSGRRLPFAIEVIGFSEEEGVRFGVPFIGSRAFIGDVDNELLASIAGDAIAAFGLDPSRIGEARAGDDALGYLEFHIEQGPVLESLRLAARRRGSHRRPEPPGCAL